MMQRCTIGSYVTVFIVSLTTVLSSEIGCNENVKRDLDQYVILQYKENPAKEDDWSSMQNGFRAFLWEQWQSKHLGLLRLSTYTLEGDATRSEYFIEPDSTGTWQITLCETHEMSAFLNERRVDKREFHIYRLERVIKEPNREERQIGEDEASAPGAYELIMRDDSGKIISRW